MKVKMNKFQKINNCKIKMFKFSKKTKQLNKKL